MRTSAEDVNDRAKLIIARFATRALLRDPSMVERARRVVEGWREVGPNTTT